MNLLVWHTLTVNKAWNASQEEVLSHYLEEETPVSKNDSLQDLEKLVKVSMKTLVVRSLAVRMALSAERVVFSLSQEQEEFAQNEALKSNLQCFIDIKSNQSILSINAFNKLRLHIYFCKMSL